MMPLPRHQSWDAFNASLEKQCCHRQGDILRGHCESIGERLVRNREALMALPPMPFDVCDKQSARRGPATTSVTSATRTRLEKLFWQYARQGLRQCRRLHRRLGAPSRLRSVERRGLHSAGLSRKLPWMPLNIISLAIPSASAHSAKFSGVDSHSRASQLSSTTSESKSYSAAPPQGFLKYQK